MLGTLPANNVFNLVSCIGNRDPISLLDALKEIGEQSIDYFRLMDLILENIQLLTFAKVSEESLNDLEIRKEDFKVLADLFSEEDLQLIYQVGLIAKRDMELAPNLASGFDMALLRMLSFIPGELKDKKKVNILETDQKDQITSDVVLSKVEAKVEEATSKANKKDTAILNQELSESITLISKENWKEVFDQLDLDPGTRQLASHSSFLKDDGSVIYLSMPEEKLNIFNGKHRKELQDALSQFTKVECNLFLESGNNSDDSPNKIKQQEKRKEFEDAQKEIEKDPNVQSLVEAFGAKVIESSIEPRK